MLIEMGPAPSKEGRFCQQWRLLRTGPMPLWGVLTGVSSLPRSARRCWGPAGALCPVRGTALWERCGQTGGSPDRQRSRKPAPGGKAEGTGRVQSETGGRRGGRHLTTALRGCDTAAGERLFSRPRRKEKQEPAQVPQGAGGWRQETLDLPGQLSSGIGSPGLWWDPGTGGF